ncbi:hypothetical protein [Thauera sinica]|uniref:Uncharacterized protein n=1 Tax=Thauera sinica TaxID=2665146 RepID=A0ABW1AYH9_9RHOO|nr:hypothetical protein [Thauera sp. K11]ATE60138.1 hypothetical protein CCZ27_09425 [Thauera sp. K11]
MEITIKVRQTMDSYVARHGKLTASCTAGPRQAAERLAGKIFGQFQRVTIEEVSFEPCSHSYWRIVTEPQVCRICGCTWDHACSGGCFWVEADLCSRCDGGDEQ